MCVCIDSTDGAVFCVYITSGGQRKGKGNMLFSRTGMYMDYPPLKMVLKTEFIGGHIGCDKVSDCSSGQW